MTVSEMMELLSKMDPNSVVCIYDGEYENKRSKYLFKNKEFEDAYIDVFGVQA
mgnify:CR=1 FL=1